MVEQLGSWLSFRADLQNAGGRRLDGIRQRTIGSVPPSGVPTDGSITAPRRPRTIRPDPPRLRRPAPPRLAHAVPRPLASGRGLYHLLDTASVRIDRCAAQEDALHRYEARRAQTCWDSDRRAAVEAIAAGLSGHPSQVVSQLRQSKHGCEWLIRRWQLLARWLEDGHPWTDAQGRLYLDLLGTEPDFRKAFLPSVRPALAEIAREIADLETRIRDTFAGLDAHERQSAAEQCPLVESQAMRALHRYQAACLRDYFRARKLLLSKRGPAPAEPAGAAPSQPVETMVASQPPAREVAPEEAPPKAEPQPQTSMVPAYRLSDAARPLVTGNRRQRRAAARRARRS